MAKTFAPRVSKKERKTIDLSDKLAESGFRMKDDPLLDGAKLDEIRLKDIVVKNQVRTKFNDSSLKDLSENIRANGLIQPLVLHKVGAKYTLICGERRFRAMGLIKMKDCPCFVLEHKSSEQLMAIQFSENSAREALHYIDKADGILSYQKATNASERKIQAALGISKSEVHRSLMIGKMGKKLKEAAKTYDIEKYVLLELDAIEDRSLKSSLLKKIYKGQITKRSQIKKTLSGSVVKTGTRKKSTDSIQKGLTAAAFLKAMESKTKGMKLDDQTKKLLKSLVEETKEMVDL